MHTSTMDDDAMSISNDAGRVHSALTQMRSQALRAGNDKRSVLDELRSFDNTLNGLRLSTAPRQDYHDQSYSDRLAETRADLKLLEQLVSQTFHWQPQSSAAIDSTVDQVHPLPVGLSTFSSCHL